MKTKCIFLIIYLFIISSLQAQAVINQLSNYNLNSHDISSLLDWGPYSKRYAGISHIPDIKKGLRFDFSVMPGYYRNRQLIPNVLFESSYYPWDFASSMKTITYRYQLEWQDQVYVDVTYYVLNKSKVLVEIKSVNNKDVTQNLMFNNMSYIDYPDSASKVRTKGADELKWYNAIDYKDLFMMDKTPQNNLVFDGWMRNEELCSKSKAGSILAKGFGRKKGDKVNYKVSVEQPEGDLLFRCKVDSGARCSFKATGLVSDSVIFIGTGKFELVKLAYKVEKAGSYELILQSSGETKVELDGFFIGGKNAYKNLSVYEMELPFTPELTKGKDNQDFTLKYQDVDDFYGVAWNYAESEIKQVLNSELESFFRKNTHNHVSKILIGDRRRHYTDAFLRPVVLAPKSEQKTYMLLSVGSREFVLSDIKMFHDNPDYFIRQAKELNQKVDTEWLLPESKQYLLGRKLLQASILSNISYPIYTQREFIRHFTPGKLWNSLYTWDSGFIALGLLDIDTEKAFEVIKAYTTPLKSQSAFIHHGTPLPIQIFAFFDLWNKEKNKEVLSFLYPRLKQFYDFMIGEYPTSTTRMKGSNLLRSWDYFYNSGGWDDYPPQYYFHNYDSKALVTPVVTTAFYIRAAKILRMAAKELGYNSDIKAYDKEIKLFSDALQSYSWDNDAKYFSYVVHNDEGNATGIYLYSKDSSNFNKGLDGTSPLVSGICTSEQEDALVKHLFSKKEMWTDCGISTVDQSASYYKSDGYWNGTVWMPHQWTLWKALLDCGRGKEAYKIAMTALHIWENECRESNYTFEHFIISSGRGAGWHQFSGLSSPIINWFTSYYKVGKVTTGFEIWIEKDSFQDNYSEYQATLNFDDSTNPHQRCMLICLNPDFEYVAYFNDKKIKLQSYYNGMLEVTLPALNKKGNLKIIKNQNVSIK